MSVKVTVDGKTYTGVSTIEVGGKSLSLLAEEAATLETQTVSCDSSLGGNYGGLKFNHTGGEPALYVGTPNMSPSGVAGSLTKDRFPYSFMIRIDADGSVVGTAISNLKASVTIGTALESGVVTVTGNSSIYLTHGEVQYTIQKIPM